MTYKIMGANVSPFVRKVRIFMAEKGLEYDLEQVSPFSPPAGWREISPLGKIPALLDGDRIVNDSSCICQYIERKTPLRRFSRAPMKTTSMPFGSRSSSMRVLSRSPEVRSFSL